MPDVGRIALLDAAEHAVAALDEVGARLARRRAGVVRLDRLAVGRAAVAGSGVAVVAHLAGIELAVAAPGGARRRAAAGGAAR